MKKSSKRQTSWLVQAFTFCQPPGNDFTTNKKMAGSLSSHFCLAFFSSFFVVNTLNQRINVLMFSERGRGGGRFASTSRAPNSYGPGLRFAKTLDWKPFPIIASSLESPIT